MQKLEFRIIKVVKQYKKINSRAILIMSISFKFYY